MKMFDMALKPHLIKPYTYYSQKIIISKTDNNLLIIKYDSGSTYNAYRIVMAYLSLVENEPMFNFNFNKADVVDLFDNINKSNDIVLKFSEIDFKIIKAFVIETDYTFFNN
jgi:hypothetical protein